MTKCLHFKSVCILKKQKTVHVGRNAQCVLHTHQIHFGESIG